MCREIESACKGSGREFVFLQREGERIERERERWKVCAERGVCFEIEEVCREIEGACKGCGRECVFRERVCTERWKVCAERGKECALK